MPEQKVRIGFVGVGNMGQCAHLKNYANLDICQVVAIAEIRETPASKSRCPLRHPKYLSYTRRDVAK